MVARVRVEARNYGQNEGYEERAKNFKGLLHAFRKACTVAGIQKDYKKHETYESRGAKRRWKRREAKAAVLKKLRENFTEKKKIGDF
jgi:ribosomal protein S21